MFETREKQHYVVVILIEFGGELKFIYRFSNTMTTGGASHLHKKQNN